jgi:hypothetical protein
VCVCVCVCVCIMHIYIERERYIDIYIHTDIRMYVARPSHTRYAQIKKHYVCEPRPQSEVA